MSVRCDVWPCQLDLKIRFTIAGTRRVGPKFHDGDRYTVHQFRGYLAILFTTCYHVLCTILCVSSFGPFATPFFLYGWWGICDEHIFLRFPLFGRVDCSLVHIVNTIWKVDDRGQHTLESCCRCLQKICNSFRGWNVPQGVENLCSKEDHSALHSIIMWRHVYKFCAASREWHKVFAFGEIVPQFLARNSGVLCFCPLRVLF